MLGRMGALLAAGGAALAIAADPASAQQPLESAGNTDRIVATGETTTADGYAWKHYRNLAYPCSISGYQTFAVGTRLGSSPAAARPLWVRMRGGGVGYFDAQGEPMPSPNNKSESDLAELLGFVTENALNQLINDERAGFRVVSVSMCNHDIYAGGDQPDPNNPNREPDGSPRTSNGLFATKAAIQYVQDRYPTTKTFLHGTSAGSFGTYGVAWSLQKQDRPVGGFVADAGVLNSSYESDLQRQGAPCARPPEAIAGVGARIHPALADRANEPHLLLGRGALTAPVMNVWSRDDRNSCGTNRISCTMPDGSTRTLGSMECKMSRISAAIRALAPSRHSETMQLCVRGRNAPPGDCARHVVTNADANAYPNTNPAFPADHNAAIVDWVRDRLGDRPPRLAASIGRRGRLRAERGRVALRCRAGGYERRACQAKLRARRPGTDPVIARGRAAIGAGSSGRSVRAKLTPLGRRLVRRAPRGGLPARARIDVDERYTGRFGAASRRLRIR